MSILPVQIAFAGAVLTMVLANVMPMRRVYESIDWSIIILLGAMIPVGTALQATGGTDLIANSLVNLGATNPLVILGLLMVFTSFSLGYERRLRLWFSLSSPLRRRFILVVSSDRSIVLGMVKISRVSSPVIIETFVESALKTSGCHSMLPFRVSMSFPPVRRSQTMR